MCLAVPGQVAEWHERDPLFATALVDFGGVRRPVSMACVPDADVGDYVLVHAGIAISRVDPDEAAKTLKTLDELDRAG
jgi:hydrogenase expression/formation protein HypC